jgi:uncharacterized protein YceK
VYVSIVLAVCLLLPGCSSADARGASREQTHRVVTVDVPRATNTDSEHRLRVFTGPLPAGSRMLLHLPDGEIIGAVAPYGPPKRAAYVFPVPAHAIRGEQLTLHVAMVVERRGARRAPDARELERIEVVLVPVRR